MLNPAGLPHRDWYKHTIYAPGEFTGYAAVVIPGVNEGVEAKDAARTQAQIDALAGALNKASGVLEQAAEVSLSACLWMGRPRYSGALSVARRALQLLGEGHIPQTVLHRCSPVGFCWGTIRGIPWYISRTHGEHFQEAPPMIHDIVLSLVFLSMIIAPALVAMHTEEQVEI